MSHYLVFTAKLPAKRRAAAALVGLALSSLMALGSAQASVVISSYSYSPGDPLIPFDSGPFGFAPNQAGTSGFVSQANAVDREQSRLPTGPGGAVEFRNVTDNSGFLTSLSAGQTVQAHANVSGGLGLVGAPAVSRAKSDLFGNHASAATSHQLSFWNSQPVNIDGTIWAPNSLYKEHHRSAEATSGWYDTWTASAGAQVDIKLALDGRMYGNPFCDGAINCGVLLPPGTDSFRSDQPFVDLFAKFIVYDMDLIAICDDPDECGFIGAEHPTPMSILTARTINDGDLSDLMHETTLSFQTTPGHRYMAMGYLSVRAQDGGVIDFFNTFRVTDIDVRAGVLRSAATGGDLADAFGPPANGVPLPGTLWLLLASAAAAFASRPRRWARAGQAGQ